MSTLTTFVSNLTTCNCQCTVHRPVLMSLSGSMYLQVSIECGYWPIYQALIPTLSKGVDKFRGAALTLETYAVLCMALRLSGANVHEWGWPEAACANAG